VTVDPAVVADVLGLTGPIVKTLSDVEPEPVSWLWRDRLPAGKLVVLDGDPSVGKSTLAVDWAARVSTGSPWPDGTPCPIGDVLIMSAEDGLADTIRPRLDAAGGDPRRVHALGGVAILDGDGNPVQRAVSLADAGVISSAVQRHGAVLLIIDVLMAYLPSGVDSHRDQDIRSVLARIAAVADDTGCCVVLLRHLNKTSGGNPLYRGGGSIGIVGAARAGFVAGIDPDDETRRIVACTKSNLAPMPPSLAYRLEPADNGMARVMWLGEATATAASLLSLGGPDERSERDEAVDWLTDYLQQREGQAPAGEVLKAAAADGISKVTLHRARKRAGVTTSKAGLHGGWTWSLDPRRFHEDSKDSNSQGLEPSEPSVKPSEAEGVACTVCDFPLSQVLADDGETTHPTCGVGP
jgi:AAA domain